MKKTTDNPSIWVQAGMAAYIPGLTFALELLQSQLEEMRQQLQGLQIQAATTNGASAPAKRRGRPPGQKSAGVQTYWASMTPEERRAEMRRRMEVSKSKNKAKTQDYGATPRRIGELYTVAAFADRAGVSTAAANGWLGKNGIKLRRIPHPNKKGTFIGVMSEKQFEQLLAQRGKPSPSPSKTRTGSPAGSPNHPRHPNHPLHAQWLANVTKAAQDRAARKQVA